MFVISVTGEMDEMLREQFDDVDVMVDHGVSRMRVMCPDSSLLHGLLHRIDAHGLDLIDVRSIDEMPTDDHA